MPLKLVYSAPEPSNSKKKMLRCELPCGQAPTNSKNSQPTSQSLPARHAEAFADLHSASPWLAELIDDMTSRYLRGVIQNRAAGFTDDDVND